MKVDGRRSKPINSFFAAKISSAIPNRSSNPIPSSSIPLLIQNQISTSTQTLQSPTQTNSSNPNLIRTQKAIQISNKNSRIYCTSSRIYCTSICINILPLITLRMAQPYYFDGCKIEKFMY